MSAGETPVSGSSLATLTYAEAAARALERAMRADPLLLARARLLAQGMAAAEIDAIDAAAHAEVAAALATAEAAPWPEAQAAFEDVLTTLATRAGATTWR